MHLLNAVLPAATSCASAAVAAADDAMTTSTLSVSFFMMYSWQVSGEGRRCRRRCDMVGSRWTSRETGPGFIDLACALPIVGIPGQLLPGRSTQNDPDALDSSSQIRENGCACAK